MYTNSPLNFMCTTLLLRSYAWRDAPVTSKLCTALPSWVSIINDANSASSAMVGDISSSHVYMFVGNFRLRTSSILSYRIISIE